MSWTDKKIINIAVFYIENSKTGEEMQRKMSTINNKKREIEEQETSTAKKRSKAST